MSKTQFETDLETPMNIQGGQSSLGYYNLVVTKRDMHLYCVGLKPNRNFKLNDVKKYFGLKGDKHQVNKGIIDIINRIKHDEQVSSN
jgi:hypothetical protein